MRRIGRKDIERLENTSPVSFWGGLGGATAQAPEAGCGLATACVDGSSLCIEETTGCRLTLTASACFEDSTSCSGQATVCSQGPVTPTICVSEGTGCLEDSTACAVVSS